MCKSVPNQSLLLFIVSLGSVKLGVKTIAKHILFMLWKLDLRETEHLLLS